jgi:putative transposase
MKVQTRNITFRLYPTARQARTLADWLELHRELYNAALLERREAWAKCRVSLSYRDQQNELPTLKEARPDLVPLGSHALQETVRRVDRAFKGFFRRVRAGERPGYPRFKSRSRFKSFTYPDPAGWKVLHDCKRGKLKITNLGSIRMRGKPRVVLEHGEPRALTIRNRNGKWFATISVRYPEDVLRRGRAYPDRCVGIDLGVRNLVATSDGDLIEAPRKLASALADLKRLQKELSRKKKGSRNRRKACRKLARLHQKVADSRRDFLHQLSASVVFLYALIGVESLAIRNMVRSARGTREALGKNVRQKAGLNRSVLDASFGMFLQLLAYKAEEAGGVVVQVRPNGTSQYCSSCGGKVQKGLMIRTHQCPHCGLVLDRDINAARNILFLALGKAGREPSEVWRGGITCPIEARNRHYALA